jgi:adhesin/invasin
MNIHHRLAQAVKFGVLLLSFSGVVYGVPLKENSADIRQVINVPSMAININPGGVGCNPARHETWEPAHNGCSNVEWVKATARVISVTASPPSILANNSDASILTATLVDGDGYLVGFGIPTNWGTTNGWLSSSSTATDASGKTTVALRGTVAGLATVSAAAAAGAAAANVVLVPDASTSRVVTLTPSPSTVAADGTAAGLYATVRDAYNNILPAGQPVYWSTTLNNLNTGLSYTDAGGVATATIAGASPGVSSIYARTAVSANAATNVVFTAVAPVEPEQPEAPIIESFSTSCKSKNKPYGVYPKTICVSYGAVENGGEASNTITWSAKNASSYTVTLDGATLYSGSGTSFQIVQPNIYTSSFKFTLNAIGSNGSVTSVTFVSNFFDVTPPDPSG